MASSFDLLDTLLVRYGLGKQDICNLCRIPYRHIKEWEKDKSGVADIEHPCAILIDFLETVEQTTGAECPAGWMMSPFPSLGEGYRLSPSHLYSTGDSELLLPYMRGDKSAEDILTQWRPDWRSKCYSPYRVVDRNDGERVIVAAPCPTCGQPGN